MNNIDELVNNYIKDTWDDIYNYSNILSHDDYLIYIVKCINKYHYILDKRSIKKDFNDKLWTLLKYDYKYIQSNILKGRICPICGKILVNHFIDHLKIHNMTQSDYLLMYLNLTEIPKCPICGNNRSVNLHGYYFNETCSNNRCMHSKSNFTRSDLGNNNFMYWDYSKLKSLGYTKLECDIHNENLSKHHSKVGIKYGIPINVKYYNRLFKLRSFSEFIYLLKLYYIDKLNPNNILYEVKFFTPNGLRYTDFLVDNINYEIHDDNCISDKLDFINYLLNIGIDSIYIPISDIYSIYWDMVSKFIDLNYLYKESSNCRKLGLVYNYVLG